MGIILNSLNSVGNGLGNLISGGNWRQSGSEVASQEFNSAEAQKQRDWEEEMSSSAYQRAVADMQKAGLNPVNMFMNGASQSSTPTGSSASSTFNSKNGNGSSLSTLINSALYMASKHLDNHSRGLATASTRGFRYLMGRK